MPDAINIVDCRTLAVLTKIRASQVVPISLPDAIPGHSIKYFEKSQVVTILISVAL